MNFRNIVLGAIAAAGMTAGGAAGARAADLDSIAAFALSICDAVNATGILISSADHCMKFSGEAEWDKGFYWEDGVLTDIDGHFEFDLVIEVMGDSDFGVTRFWVDLYGYANAGNYLAIDNAGISIGNTTVIATGYGDTIFNDDDAETLTHIITYELEGATGNTGGVYASITHDLGNGWSIAKAIECIDSCVQQAYPAFVGVLSYDQDGVTGHVSILANNYGSYVIDTLHAGFSAELDAATVQGALAYYYSGYWAVDGSVKAALDAVEIAVGAFYDDYHAHTGVIFSLEFDAGDFTIAKAFEYGIYDGSFPAWEWSVEVSTDLSDTLNLTAGFDIYDDNDADTAWDRWEVYKTLDWTPGGGYEAETTLSFGAYNGSYSFGSLESTVSFEF